MNRIITIVKRNFMSNLISIIITLFAVFSATTSSQSSIAISNGNYTWILAIMAPFFVVLFDFTKLIHLGCSKKDYFIGSLVSYGCFALIISIINTCIHTVIDPLNKTQTVYNLIDLCGWSENGIFLSMLQQMVFLFLVMVFLHVFISMQHDWYGWLTDVILVAIICIFISVTALRSLLLSFFTLIMFNQNFIVHLMACVVLSVGFSFINRLILKNRSL